MIFTQQSRGGSPRRYCHSWQTILVVATAKSRPGEEETEMTPAPDKADIESITRVQIFLDENRFGPGKIDGRLGQFTEKALAHYNSPPAWIRRIGGRS